MDVEQLLRFYVEKYFGENALWLQNHRW
jgi:hypothetical protein